MPRWRHLCKEGEEPTRIVGMEELQKELDCKRSIGWSEIPEEWVPAIKELVQKLRERWIVDGAGMLYFSDKPEEMDVDIEIDQIKDKFGTLRFYYSTKGENADYIYDEVDKYVNECEKRLEKDDPHYGKPY